MIRLLRVSVLAVLVAALAATCAAVPWNGGRGTGNRGIFPEVTFPATPAVVWKAYLGPDYAGLHPSNTLVAADNVIVAYDKYLLAVSTQTGEPRWKRELYEPPLGDILLLDGKLIITTQHGFVFAVNPITGDQLWKVKLSDGLRNGPVLANNILFYTAKSGVVEAVDLAGKSFTVTRGTEKMEAAPVLLGKTLLLCYSSGTIMRVEENGISRWSITLPNTLLGVTPATDGRILLVSTPLGVYAINPFERDRAIRWFYPCSDRVTDGALLDNTRVYLATKSGELRNIDLATGKDVWTRKELRVDNGADVEKTKQGIVLPAPPIGGPVVLGDTLLVRMEFGLLGLYHKETGKQLWMYQLMPPLGATLPERYFTGMPAIDGNDIYFAGTDTFIYRLSSTATDIDPPAFTSVMPVESTRGYLTPDLLQYFGAVISDEGAGLHAGLISLTLDKEDLSPLLQRDPESGYYYVPINPLSLPMPGLHRLTFTAKDQRGNIGKEERSFIIAPPNMDYVEVNISGEFVPQVLRVRPGTVLVWNNTAGGPRTVLSEAEDTALKFTSDTMYPDGIPDKERFVWIVPDDIEIGTVIFYHCRLNGKPSDGEHLGEGLAGVLEIVEANAVMPMAPVENPEPEPGLEPGMEPGMDPRGEPGMAPGGEPRLNPGGIQRPGLPPSLRRPRRGLDDEMRD